MFNVSIKKILRKNHYLITYGARVSTLRFLVMGSLNRFGALDFLDGIRKALARGLPLSDLELM